MMEKSSDTVKSYLIKIGNMYLAKSSIWSGSVNLTSNFFSAYEIREVGFKEGDLTRYIHSLVNELKKLEFENIEIVEKKTVTVVYESKLELEEL